MKVHMFIFKLNECVSGLLNEFAGFIDLKKIHTSGWMIHGCDRIPPLFNPWSEKHDLFQQGFCGGFVFLSLY